MPEPPDSAAAPALWDTLAPPPDAIRERVAACVAYVTAAVGVPPDLTSDTLPLVDHYLARARADIAERPALTELIVQAVGAYLGEVIRREVDMFWVVPSADVHDWRLCGREVFLSLNPVGAAWEILRESTEHVGPSGELLLAREDRELVEGRLAALPPLPVDQFYTLAARLEAVQVAADALRRQMEEGGTADVVFTEEDYFPDAVGDA